MFNNHEDKTEKMIVRIGVTLMIIGAIMVVTGVVGTIMYFIKLLLL